MKPRPKTTYAIGVGVDPNQLDVKATLDGFGMFETRAAAAARLIALVDERMDTLRRSRRRAARILKQETSR